MADDGVKILAREGNFANIGGKTLARTGNIFANSGGINRHRRGNIFAFFGGTTLSREDTLTRPLRGNETGMYKFL